MGKRETEGQVVRRVGREAFGFLAEAGFAGPQHIDGGFDYVGHGLRIAIHYYYWANESAVSACVHLVDDPRPRSFAGIAELYAECGLGAVNHLPHSARGVRLTELRVRAFAAALRALLPFLLAPDRFELVRRASGRD